MIALALNNHESWYAIKKETKPNIISFITLYTELIYISL